MKKQNVKYFKLYAHCIPVKGHCRSIIYDLQRLDFEIIPNELFYFTQLLEKESLEQIEANTLEEDIQIIDEYLSFLSDKDFGFYLSEGELHTFPKIEYSWKSNSTIENCILDVTNLTLRHVQKLLNILEATCCENLALKIYSNIPRESILKLLSAFDFSIVCNIYIYTFAKTKDDFRFFENIAVTNKRVNRIYIDPTYQSQSYPIKNKKVFILPDPNGQYIKSKYFKVNLRHFMEAHFHHTYFNRKIYISGNGLIQNSEDIFLNESFNLAKDDVRSILNGINSTANQNYWNVRKDNTETCKDCEFRYMCLDNRQPIKQKSTDLWKFDMECDYNPYTSEWKSK